MVMSITDVLNLWNTMGVFSYVLPFLLIFAVVYAILLKSKILHENKGTGTEVKAEPNKGLLAIISVSVSLLALQFDLVSTFFSQIFPRFGIGLAIVLVLLIFFGLLGVKIPIAGEGGDGSVKAIAWIVGIGVVVWALYNWDYWGGYFGPGFGLWWIGEYFWSLVILGGIIGLIYSTVKK